jgi:hypothetical protein
VNQPSGSTTAERGGPVRAGDAFAGQVATPSENPSVLLAVCNPVQRTLKMMAHER